jgi:manganese transport protein
MYAPAIGRASLTERTVLAGREVFLGRRRGPLAILPFVCPAVIAAIAYGPKPADTIGRQRG